MPATVVAMLNEYPRKCAIKLTFYLITNRTGHHKDISVRIGLGTNKFRLGAKEKRAQKGGPYAQRF